MMPNPQQGPAGPMPAPVPGPGGQGSGEGGANPDEIKSQLVMLLSKAKEVAEANGVDFKEILAMVEGNKVKSDVPLPRPPGSGAGGPPQAAGY